MEYVADFLATDFLIVRAMRRWIEANDMIMLLSARTRHRVDSDTAGLHTSASAEFLSVMFNW